MTLFSSKYGNLTSSLFQTGFILNKAVSRDLEPAYGRSFTIVLLSHLRCNAYLVQLYVGAVILLKVLLAVDRGNFKTCDQSSFCKRQRSYSPVQSPYELEPSTLSFTSSGVRGRLLNTAANVAFQFDLFVLEDNTLRLKVNEASPVNARFEIPVGEVLVEDPKTQSAKLVEHDDKKIVIEFQGNKVAIQVSPFRIDVISDNEPVVSINSHGLLNFEHLRQKTPKPEQVEPKVEDDGEKTDEENADDEVKNEDQKEEDTGKDEEGMWEETFKSHTDTKPKGPSSVGLDVSFPGFEFVYGIPEHADDLALKTTKSGDPYRLYNLDVFEYELHNPMALYGSVPLMLAHNEKQTVSLLWLNAAETWIDISSNTADKNMFSKLVDFVKGDADIPQVDTHWFSESGIIDVFIMLGPRPNDVFRQYARLTGTTPLPPLFALGYHQSRWNYNDEQDVASVDAGFDDHDIPMDVIWLDIEHTDGKRYFTWDNLRFPDPEFMIQNISAKGRKIVTIIDPHIKRDDNYHVYRDAKDIDGYFIKNKDGHIYDGWCWPGSSAWLDFLDPKVREFWASRFLPENYKGSNPNLFTWNDMNEPSVFNGPEITMHKDAKHFGGWEHRDVHNLYGLLVHRSTIEGQHLRSQSHRPFVLSRAFFAGTQRYGAVWTGDNTGDWSHLKISLPMVMSLNLVGIQFSGADVGGYFKNPDAELLTRWYQAAAFQPFFRAHAHVDTKRREPWLLPPDNLKAIREAIRLRYRLLPYWYTLFYNSEKTGQPVMKPLWVDFPTEKATFKIESDHLVGSAILAHPVTDSGSAGVSVYLPGQDELWYNAESFLLHKGGSVTYVPVDLFKIPLFYRGGFIIPTHERSRRASVLAAEDPYSLIVALNAQGEASGDLYHDDFFSFRYQSGEFVHRQFNFSNGQLISRNLNPTGQFETEAWLERVVVLGLNYQPQQALLTASGLSSPVQLETTYNSEKKLLVIRKPAVKIVNDFEITLK